MNDEFENEFDFEDGRDRGRSRRREGGGTSSRHTFTPAYGMAGRSSRSGAGNGDRVRGSGAAAGRTGAGHRPAAGSGLGGSAAVSRRAGSGGGNSGRAVGGSGRGDTKAAQNRQRVKRIRRRIIGLIIAELFALCFIFGYRYVKHKASLFQVDDSIDMKTMTNPYISVEKEEAMKGYWTVALFGVDSRNNSVGKGNMADVIIICNINQENGEIKLASVFRDTYLNIDEGSSYNKINTAYFLGGPEQAVKALNRNLDLEIDDYAVFNWKAVAEAINILGGVDVELSKAEFYYINAYITDTVKGTGIGSVQLKSAGANHLDGVQAVAYARLRKMDTDFARTERQREIIQKCFDKLKKANFSVINNVMEVVFPQILSSVTIDDVIPAARNLTKYTIAGTTGFPAARSDANMGKKGDCVIPQTLESNVVALHEFLFGDESYQPSDMVKKISAKISADTGMYSEGKPVESVGTDGGYIPKATEKTTEATKSTEDESTKATDENGDEIDESIIDGENEWDLEIETDEYGYPIDPPEDYDYGTGVVRPSKPTNGTNASESSSEAQLPGETAGTNYPGAVYPGADTTSEAEEPGNVSGPGDALYPGDNTSGPGAGSTTPTRPVPTPEETESTGPTGGRGTLAPFPGANQEETEDNGPGSIIIGPGL